MQPTYDESSNSDTGSWSSVPAPAPGYAPPPPVDTVTRARPWLTALWSFVTLLVIIAAAANQWVVDAVARHSNGQTLGDRMAHVVYVYAWRFDPQGGHDFARMWVAGLAGVGTTLVLTFLLVAVVARGYGSFSQTLFSVWFVVLAATLIGGYVRTGLTDVNQLEVQHESVAYNTLFSTQSPNTTTIIAGFIVGLIVAFLAAVVAVATRRSNVVAAPPPPSFGVPWSRSDDDEDRPWQAAPVPGPTASPSPWSSSDTERAGSASGPEQTAQLPTVEQSRSDDDATVEHPPPTPSTPAPGEDGDDATTQFPRHATTPQSDS